MKKIDCKIIENKKIADGFYRMAIKSAYLARRSKPGQFVEVKCSENPEPLLRRPFGVHRITKSGIELLYEVVGRGTEVLSRRKAGELLDVIGPLGNGFDYKGTTHDARRTTIIVAGGVGVASLVALAGALVHSPQSTVHRKRKKIFVLIGAKSKNHILCKNDFKKLGAEVIISTEDGSEGKRGFITDCLKSLLSTVDRGLWTIYACGPTGMLKAVAGIARAARVKCQVSLEERMACGVGVCLGCPVKVRTHDARRTTHDEFKMVCKDGPVFDAEEIAW